MTLVEIFAVAVALAMDAFAVSVAAAVSLPAVTWRHCFRLSFHFGLFQFLMPVIGWGLGMSVYEFIEHWDHWIAFAMLTLVGLGMLKEARNGSGEEQREGDITRGFLLVMLSVATSIDAMAVGLSLAMIGVSVWGPAVFIGVVCAVLTLTGIALGRLVGRSATLGSKASVLGALVLFGIGLKILHEHGVF
ncbi:manganese efflux pump MntP family protein [uncultured Mailhella sp.]|uniref:manganese efflux pump MntP n=1 Tax=uncultured Mailhella sp. TaxID=1981031 RepID=UPI00260F8BC5|nr:manganese efflux pump MntP family protein [uncultured Mailhella sp.]